MAGRKKCFGILFALFLVVGSFVAVGSSVAVAAPSVICTWTGAVNTDISVADNWSPNSGESCGGSSTTSGSAALGGAQVVFPSVIPGTGSMLTLDAAESVDDMTFDGSYVISGTNVLTLSPSMNGLVGIDVAMGGGATILTPVDLGMSQIFEAAQFQTLYLEGAIAGAGYSLTIGNGGDLGMVEMTAPNSYGGPTTVADGSLEIRNSGSLGSGAVVVDSGASLLEYSSGGISVDPANDLTLSGAGFTGNSGALEDYTGGSGWAGQITLDGGAAIAAESNSELFSIAGSIAGVGPLTLSGSGTMELFGSGTSYTGSTIIASLTTVKSGVADALPASTSLSIASGASLNLNSFAQTLAGLSGPGSVTSSGVTPATLALSPGGSDTVDTTITGNLELEMPGTGTAVLTSTGNSYTQGTSVVNGVLRSGATDALPLGSQLSVSATATFDMAGFAQELSSLVGSGTVTSSSGSPVLTIDVSSGSSDSWSGSLAEGLGIDSSGAGTLILASVGNTYTGTSNVASGIVDVAGSAADSVFSVDSGATLEGGGTVGGILSNAGTVHPGTSTSGILSSAGAATLGNGTFSIDISGFQPGSGYSQLSAPGNAVDLAGSLLEVNDSYGGSYGTVYDIVTAGSITGSFANVAWGTEITSGGRKLLLGHSSTEITLTDVTDPPQAPASSSSEPAMPLPPSGAVSYSGGSSASPSGSAQASNDGTTVTGRGVGALLVYQFGADPVGAPNFQPAGEYFGIESSVGSSFSSVTITDCNLNGGSILEWWNPILNSGVGGWQEVSPAAIFSQGDPSTLCRQG